MRKRKYRPFEIVVVDEWMDGWMPTYNHKETIPDEIFAKE